MAQWLRSHHLRHSTARQGANFPAPRGGTENGGRHLVHALQKPWGAQDDDRACVDRGGRGEEDGGVASVEGVRQ